MRAKTHLNFTLALFLAALPMSAEQLALPWQEAGLSARQAAAHMLDRFAFGARPGEVDEVVAMGLEVWLEKQLAADQPEPIVEAQLEDFHSLSLSALELRKTYPTFFRIRREAERAGVISRPEEPSANGEETETVALAKGGERGRPSWAERRKLLAFVKERGYRPLPELMDELTSQKLLRARYAENQLREVLTDFWFNHFNVSISDNEARPYVIAYERDAIRPHVLGSFEEMLTSTAQHPAMLHYLDNARSVAAEGTRTLGKPRFGRRSLGRELGGQGLGRRQDLGRRQGLGRPSRETGQDRRARGGFEMGDVDPELRRFVEARRPRGLNENYARELMELHTLGVDGGYSQTDVIEIARAFTGWATYPEGPLGDTIRARIARMPAGMSTRGFVFGESFLFRADAHDAEKKTILGEKYPAGRGVEEGLRVLQTLSTHSSTAQHLARKLAIRFVSDQPPQHLIDHLASRFLATGGDLSQVVRALAVSPAFWSAEARRSKIKSPFELAVSALRGLGAEIEQPFEVIEWIAKMGQPLYAFQAPTGYPDRADAWVNTGSLLARMNFGLQLATRRIPGVRFDLAALNEHREPESVTAALETYLGLLLPGRDPAETTRQLTSVVNDPELAKKVEAAAGQESLPRQAWRDDLERMVEFGDGRRDRGRRGRWYQRPRAAAVQADASPLAHVVGVLLGSPEYQRR